MSENSDYKITWCHTCLHPIIACNKCNATSCNGMLCCTHKDLKVLSSEMLIDERSFQSLEDQSIDIEGKNLSELILKMTSISYNAAVNQYRGAQMSDYLVAVTRLADIAAHLIADGETVWTIEKAKYYASRFDESILRMFQ